MEKKEGFYFSTRDLMVMAALAALGGVASAYINFIGDFFQSLLGFAGTTQWAAGLHVIWLMLAVGLVRKPGAGTATGILKGFVEFLSGNTHGLLVLIVNILAGLVIDLVLLPRKDKQPGLLFYLAAGLASASNIFVFQFFASIPEDVLTLLAILITSLVSFASGVVFGGLLTQSLLAALHSVGLLNAQPAPAPRKNLWPVSIAILGVFMIAGAGYLYTQQQTQTQIITVGGRVANPFQYSAASLGFAETEGKSELNGVERKFSGILIADLIAYAEPVDKTGLLQVSANDGYSFFISLDEVFSNPNLLLSAQEIGDRTIYSIVGAQSSKAWVRGVNDMRIISSSQIVVGGNAENPFTFNPSDWLGEMDSTFLNLDGEKEKLQGVPLRSLWQKSVPFADAKRIILSGASQSIELDGALLKDDERRIFTRLGDEGMEFILAMMNGEVLLRDIHSIEIE